MKFPVHLAVAAFLSLASAATAEDKDTSGVKDYLVSTLEKVDAAGKDFEKNAQAYAAILAESDGDYAKAAATKGPELEALIGNMRENYKAIDSYGYETVEGIVAGVDELASYDIYLDAGVPKGEGAPEEVSPLVLRLSTGETLEQPGAGFTYIIEPALWGGDPALVVPLDLNGDGTVAPRESLPKAEILTAIAADTSAKLSQLLADAKAWQPSEQDCFDALITMTPTLSEYFEDWKESRYTETQSGRFFAVSRVSDMKGIMKSCAIMYEAVDTRVAEKDKALAKAASNGFDEILTFLDRLAEREKKDTMSAAEIDELANQAKAKTDQLVPQIKQAAALLAISVSA